MNETYVIYVPVKSEVLPRWIDSDMGWKDSIEKIIPELETVEQGGWIISIDYGVRFINYGWRVSIDVCMENPTIDWEDDDAVKNLLKQSEKTKQTFVELINNKIDVLNEELSKEEICNLPYTDEGFFKNNSFWIKVSPYMTNVEYKKLKFEHITEEEIDFEKIWI